MEEATNGGLLYHEVQEAKLCAVHCVNTVLQGPFFSQLDLAAIATILDREEREVMLVGSTSGDFRSHESHNVSSHGDFSIQVLQRALGVWDLQVIPINSPAAEAARISPQLENAFICHFNNHWFCIRKVNGEWYNFDSLLVAPQHHSKFFLSAYLDSLVSFGWSIFTVRGDFPKEFPISSSETSKSKIYGQWLSPEEVKRLTKLCNFTQAPQPPRSVNTTEQQNTEMVVDIEDEDLKTAIAASLVDFPEAATLQDVPADSPKPGSSQNVPVIDSPDADTCQDLRAGEPTTEVDICRNESADESTSNADVHEDAECASPQKEISRTNVPADSPKPDSPQNVPVIDSPDAATSQDFCAGEPTTKVDICRNESADESTSNADICRNSC